MKKICLILWLALQINALFASDFVTKGFIITTDSVKVDGYLKLFRSDFTPNYITFSTEEFGKYLTFYPGDIKAFQYNDRHFVSANTQVETSPDKTSLLNSDPRFLLENKQIFMEVVVNGEKMLYKNVTPLKSCYYIGKQNLPELLLYKLYIKEVDKKQIKVENKKFIGQLINYFDGLNSIIEILNKTEYTEKSIVQLFNIYNKTKGVQSEFRKNKPTSSKLNIGITTGAIYHNLKDYESQYKVYNFNNRLNPIIGAYGAYTFPKQLWTVNSEFFYSGKITRYSYVNDYANDLYFNEKTYNSEYMAFLVDLYIHYPFRLKKGELFLNAGIYNTFATFTKSTFTGYEKIYQYENTDNTASKSRYFGDFGILGGIGWSLNRFMLELRYFSGKYKNPDAFTNTDKFSLMLSYRIL